WGASSGRGSCSTTGSRPGDDRTSFSASAHRQGCEGGGRGPAVSASPARGPKNQGDRSSDQYMTTVPRRRTALSLPELEDMVGAKRSHFARSVRVEPVAHVRALFAGIVALMIDNMGRGRVQQHLPCAVLAVRTGPGSDPYP